MKTYYFDNYNIHLDALTPVTFDVDVTKAVTLPKAGVVALTLQLA